ncbi:MAG: serine/threonine protein kinase [Myxococcales bacterium]|nr:serine/threonine protein kinase [Myxococcales bacterium]
MQTTGRRFVFGRCLGRGSFGEVYAATMRSPGGLETRVAVKVLRADIDLHGSAVQRLRDEGRILARLNHPAILNVHDLVTLDGRLALVTELVEGADLSSMIGEMPPRALLEALGQVAGALAAAAGAEGPDGRSLQLVHRDVKPSNIRVDRHGRAKLLDFGIARFDASDREVRTASDLVVGSVPYMAPERFVQREVLPSSDVFSLGCCLYEGLFGRRLYGTAKVAEISALAYEDGAYADLLAERLQGVDLHPVVLGLLVDLVAVDPSHRPTAAAAADRFEEAADQLDGPSLRMFCQHREWPEDTRLDGALEGSTLDERPEDEEPEPLDEPELPVVQRSPVETLEGTAPMAPLRLDSPDAPTVMDDGSPAWREPAEPTLDDLPPLDLDELVAQAASVEVQPIVRRREEPADTGVGVGRLALLGVVGIVVVAIASAAAGVFVFVGVLGALSL